MLLCQIIQCFIYIIIDFKTKLKEGNANDQEIAKEDISDSEEEKVDLPGKG